MYGSDSRIGRPGIATRIRSRDISAKPSSDLATRSTKQNADDPMLDPQAIAFFAERFALSPREAEMIPGLLRDEKELNIAAGLGLSPHTVHTHTERLYRKVGVSSRVQLVVRLASGLLAESGACRGESLPG